MRKWLPTIVSALAVVAMCGFIFFMSDRPADESGAMSMEVVKAIVGLFVPNLNQMDPAVQHELMKGIEHVVRKIAHFSEYALLGALTANLVRQIVRARSAGSRRIEVSMLPVALAWFLPTVYAVTDEFHQTFVPGRACLFTDVLIDSSGVLVGVLLFVGLPVLFRKRDRAH